MTSTRRLLGLICCSLFGLVPAQREPIHLLYLEEFEATRVQATPAVHRGVEKYMEDHPDNNLTDYDIR